MIPSEMARPVRLDQIGETARVETITATADERAALARRFALIAIDRLVATASLRRAGDRLFAEGRVEADVVQACAATGAPLPVAIVEPFAIRFEPGAEAGEEVELDAADLDVVAYDGGAIDLGEAVAETLALAIDPFLRAPGAEEVLREAGVLGEAEAEAEVGPFAGLKALMKKG